MNKRNVRVTRPKVDNSFGAVKARLGIHIKRDVCDPKKWVVTSYKKTYHQRFSTAFAATIWCWKNFQHIVEEHTRR